MLELGEKSFEQHQKMGQRIGVLQPDIVWFIGEDHEAFRKGLEATSFQKKAYFSKDNDHKLALTIGSTLQSGDIILIKGSRGLKLERVLKAWKPINF